jgi:hypothetical protein
MKYKQPIFRFAWKFCALGAAALASFVTTYLLWRTQLASRPINIGSDIVRWGLGSALCAIALSLPMLATPRRRSAVCLLMVSICAFGAVAYLYASQLACSIKVVNVCAPLF